MKVGNYLNNILLIFGINMNWNKELDKIAEQIKGEKDATNSALGKDNASIGISVSTGAHNTINQKLIKLEEVNKVITAEGALKDYEDIAKDETISADVKLVKIFKIVVKLLLAIRTNQMGGVKKDQRPANMPVVPPAK